MSYLLLALAVVLASFAWAGIRSPNGSRPIWVVALVASEAAGPFALVSGLVAAGIVWRQWAGGIPGAVAAWSCVWAAAGFLVAFARGMLTRPVFAAAAREATGAPVRIPVPVASAFVPVPRRPRGVTVAEHRYGPHERHVMDVMSSGDGIGRPVFVYVHGGGWWRGRRHTQARPLRHLLARSGWVVCAPSYRLSPEATVPDHLIDVKRAIAWIRANADALGIDPGFVTIGGGSTGGNLAALVALTGGDRRLQPEFEDADTSVRACIPLYGVHDMLRSSGEPLWPYLERVVMKSSPADDPEAWRRASPARMATSQRPPFFVVHGAADTLVWPTLSRRLVDALESVGGPPVHHLEVPWANHGFDFFAGPRGRMAAHAVRHVLDGLHGARGDG